MLLVMDKIINDANIHPNAGGNMQRHIANPFSSIVYCVVTLLLRVGTQLHVVECLPLFVRRPRLRFCIQVVIRILVEPRKLDPESDLHIVLRVDWKEK